MLKPAGRKTHKCYGSKRCVGNRNNKQGGSFRNKLGPAKTYDCHVRQDHMDTSCKLTTYIHSRANVSSVGSDVRMVNQESWKSYTFK